MPAPASVTSSVYTATRSASVAASAAASPSAPTATSAGSPSDGSNSGTAPTICTRAGTLRIRIVTQSIPTLAWAPVRLNFCVGNFVPPHTIAAPRTNNRFPRIDPVMLARTTS